MEEETRSVEVTPQDIANALNGISDWVRSVRSAVLRMDPATAATIELPLMMESQSPPAQATGCPPKRSRSSADQTSTASGVWSIVPATRSDAPGCCRTQACFWSAQSIATNAANSLSMVFLLSG